MFTVTLLTRRQLQQALLMLQQDGKNPTRANVDATLKADLHACMWDASKRSTNTLRSSRQCP